MCEPKKTEKTARIVVLGSANVDISALTDVFPRAGETVSGKSVCIGMGGKGTNQATAAARMGAHVSMITKLGTDFFASIPRAHYEKEGMDTRYVTETSEAGTGCALIEVHKTTGENRITVIPGANHLIEEGDLLAAEAEIAASDVLLTQMETNPSSVEAFLRLGKKHGIPVVLNPAPALPIPAHWYEMIDTITPNETETATYTGVEVHDEKSALVAASVFAGWGVKHVIITLGSRGVFCADFSDPLCPRYETVPTTRVEAVDTTGAGDCFNGVYCAAYGASETKGFARMTEAARLASRAATLSVTRRGAAESMPHKEELI